ncbi:hypothetical protein [Streptomyces boninensis]|uniref:hypothetical protein n=1 Tax=Streptomyces boninensis TaxID=2039455 RepID=UPI003B2276DA
MRSFFRQLRGKVRQDPREVALAYGKYLWDSKAESVKAERRLRDSKFYVGISTAEYGFEDLTKKVPLIADTLLLSHDRRDSNACLLRRETSDLSPGRFSGDGLDRETNIEMETVTSYMHCPSLSTLGSWILGSEPLMKAGLAWYLPTYSTQTSGFSTSPADPDGVYVGDREHASAIDYLVRDGRVIDGAGVRPEKSKYVRPILEIELPFLENVPLGDFSRITIEEFDSYASVRRYMRKSFRSLGDALNSVDSQLALDAIRDEIEEQVSISASQMEAASRGTVLSALEVGVGTVTVALSAVYSPIFQEVITALGVGATGGAVWHLLKVKEENNRRAAEGPDWTYVWSLQQVSEAKKRHRVNAPD